MSAMLTQTPAMKDILASRRLLERFSWVPSVGRMTDTIGRRPVRRRAAQPPGSVVVTRKRRCTLLAAYSQPLVGGWEHWPRGTRSGSRTIGFPRRPPCNEAFANEVRARELQSKQDLALVPPGTELRREREQLKTSGPTTKLADQLQAKHRSGFDVLLRSDLALPDPDVVGAVNATVAPLTEFAYSLK